MQQANLAQENLESKSDIPNFVKKGDCDDKLKIQLKILLQIKQQMYLLKTIYMNRQKELN